MTWANSALNPIALDPSPRGEVAARRAEPVPAKAGRGATTPRFREASPLPAPSVSLREAPPPKGEDFGRTKSQAGFSLIEALIALAIIAAMTGALVETLAADAHARFAVQQRRAALLIAQSALARASGGEAADSGHSQVLGPDLNWHIDREPYQQNDVPFAVTRLERLTVTVADAEGHPLARLATVRIVP